MTEERARTVWRKKSVWIERWKIRAGMVCLKFEEDKDLPFEKEHSGLFF